MTAKVRKPQRKMSLVQARKFLTDGYGCAECMGCNACAATETIFAELTRLKHQVAAMKRKNK